MTPNPHPPSQTKLTHWLVIIVYITAAWAVDREVFIDFGVLGLPLGCSWPPLGSLLAALGLLWAALGPLGDALGCQDNFLIFVEKDAQFRANVSIGTRLRIECSLPEFTYGARPACPFSHARGARIT